MLHQETILMINHLVREGVPIASVARRFGVSRQTVYNQLKRERSAPKPRRRRRSKLEAFKKYISARLASFDLPATKLLREIRARGYSGGITIVREFVAGVKEHEIRRITERFETLPGQQAQVDWGECGTIVIDGVRRKLYVFVFVLGYSRMMYARFTTSTRRHVLLRCLKLAFEVLGIPVEVLVDNMKQAVDRHAAGQEVRFNRQFLDFCEHYGVMPLAAPPYWPRIKGKVERGVGYVKRSFLEGARFVDLDDLNRQLERWLDDVANVRVHGTTKCPPTERHSQEQQVLRSAHLVAAYDTRPQEIRTVNIDSHISYNGVRYSVWPVPNLRVVTVRADGETIGSPMTIFGPDGVVAEHRIAPRAAGPVTLPEHRDEIRRLNRSRAPARRKAKTPRFEQLSDESAGSGWVPEVAVQTHSLENYERLAGVMT